MGNNLNADITDKHVLLKESWFASTVMGADVRERVFLAEGGFGYSPDTAGNAVYGKFIVDGEECRVEGYHLDARFATLAEITVALAERDRRGLPPSKEILRAYRPVMSVFTDAEQAALDALLDQGYRWYFFVEEGAWSLSDSDADSHAAFVSEDGEYVNIRDWVRV